MKRYVIQAVTTVIAGLILALMVAECRHRREMHDDIIRMKEKLETK